MPLRRPWRLLSCVRCGVSDVASLRFCSKCFGIVCGECLAGTSSQKRTGASCKPQSAEGHATSGRMFPSCLVCARSADFKLLFDASDLARKICDELRHGTDVWSLDCCICGDLVIANRTCPTCTAVYCSNCFDTWRQHSGRARALVVCAICKSGYQPEGFVHDRFAARLVRTWIQLESVPSAVEGDKPPQSTSQIRSGDLVSDKGLGCTPRDVVSIVLLVIKFGLVIILLQAVFVALTMSEVVTAIILCFCAAIAYATKHLLMRPGISALLLTFILFGCQRAYPHYVLFPIAGIVPVHALVSPDMAGQIALSGISRSSTSVPCLIEGGWIPPLVDLLQHGNLVSRERALYVLCVVSSFSVETGQVLAQAGVIAPLSRILYDAGDLRNTALATFRNMACSHARIGMVLVEVGLIRYMLNFILGEFDMEAKLEAVGCVSCVLAENQEWLAQSDYSMLNHIASKLIGWLSATEGGTTEQWIISGLYAFAQCHKNQKLRYRILKRGLPHFMHILQEPDRSTETTRIIANALLDDIRNVSTHYPTQRCDEDGTGAGSSATELGLHVQTQLN